MKKLICALGLLAILGSCGIGNSFGSLTGSSTSASSGRSSGSGSSAFGRRQATQVQVDQHVRADGRTLISVVKKARFERTRDGGIIHARGVAPRQGYYKARLISPTDYAVDENGVLTLEFRAVEPKFRTHVSTERSREIDVGLFISNQKLAAARSIRILGRQNEIRLRN